VPAEHRSPNFVETVNRNHDVLAAPSVESLVVHLILEKVPDWPLDAHKTLLDRYFNQRNQKTGFRAPEPFEAGLVLALAERYRAAGASEEAKSLLSFAADNAQNFQVLSSIERGFDPEIAIDWGVLIPDNTPKQSDASTGTDIKPALRPEGAPIHPEDMGAVDTCSEDQPAEESMPLPANTHALLDPDQAVTPDVIDRTTTASDSTLKRAGS
jgi:hypothetical protein